MTISAIKDADPFGRDDTLVLDTNKVRVLAPWERTFDRFATPLEHFIHRETASGLLLFACTLLALGIANSELAGLYHRLLEIPLSVGLGSWQISKTLHHWVNDGLMTLFFFVVGLEIKREMLVGERASPRQAALPIIAAVAGMSVPALLCASLFPAGIAGQGWGIPMATDIAFALGALVLLGTRIPRSVLTFLLALAIVDDLGALVIIPLFALANAGIPLDLDTLAGMVRHPVTWGVMVGLLVGKTAGISLATWLALKSGGVQLPRDMGIRQVVGVALLAGIGFTMSMFITELAFGDSPELVTAAKSGILFASLLAGMLGILWLRVLVPMPAASTRPT